MVRRLVAVGIVVVVLILLAFFVQSCRDSRREQAFTDYARDSGELVEESSGLSRSLFGLLRDSEGQSAVELESRMNGLSVSAEQLAERAQGTETPDQLAEAQGFLAETLALRRDAVRGVAAELPRALGDDGRDEAARRIAREMRVLLASDVIYERRFVPALEGLLETDAPRARSSIVEGVFLPDAGWIDPKIVATRIGRIRSGGGDERTASPGLHGLALGSVTATPAGTELVAGGPVELSGAEGLGFDVDVQNQGENEEQITVRLRIASDGGGEPVELEEQLDKPLAPGQSETVSVPLAEAPPPGGAATVEVEVASVPGEEKKDNNAGSFPVSFTP